ncbi:hypothetical protein PPYR_00466 [Photinus pyralis]|uniref:TIMELESS-interacting protein n=1 Tax=Photinus pyralis TaxID=7054 RepID=A0A1Y1NHA1_PHOPY|nr:TIMELESS-interacting protein [Photinus pyralis]KAB0803496.1 hypothetical protein PPYR_00466 [Photinus pyralis]
MADELSSDEDIGGEIRSEDENELEVIQEPGEGEVLQETENVEAQEDANGDGENAQKQEAKVKRVRNPQPKLNADRLKGPRGIQTVEGILKKIKFKGRGHEEEDLNSLMRGYEYWCHRLFPKFTFDDCLDRIERLGKKREVQTYIKRVRMNLLFDDIDGTIPNADDDENETETNDTQNTASEPFDTLFSREESNANSAPTQEPANQITSEMLERIRINRERAQRIRRQKMIISAPVDVSPSVSQNQQPVDPDFVLPEVPRSQNHTESTQNDTQLVSSNVMEESEMPVDVPREESLLSSEDGSRNITISDIDSQN